MGYASRLMRRSPGIGAGVTKSALRGAWASNGTPARVHRSGMNPSAVQVLATVLFGLAVLHTFAVKRFARWAHHYPEGSIQENVLHFMAETEVV
ncbi:MAG: putative Na+/H+ antiporter, partial [Verrucomicrobiota bacterium]